MLALRQKRTSKLIQSTIYGALRLVEVRKNTSMHLKGPKQVLSNASVPAPY